MSLLDSEEVATIFRENFSSLCRFLESIVGRDGAAQDIAQESFLRLCRTEFDRIPAAEIRFWLFRVGRNLALNEISKVRTRARLWKKIEIFLSRRQINPEELLAQRENKHAIFALLDQLPERQRSALLLREMEEMSYREIAFALNVGEGNVKIDIYRARQKLQSLRFARAANDKEIESGVKTRG